MNIIDHISLRCKGIEIALTDLKNNNELGDIDKLSAISELSGKYKELMQILKCISIGIITK